MWDWSKEGVTIEMLQSFDEGVEKLVSRIAKATKGKLMLQVVN